MSPIVVERGAACRVDRNEALRYLGYAGQSVSGEVASRIDEAIESCERIGRPMWCYQVLSAAEFEEVGGASLAVDGFSGEGALADAVAFMACSIGIAFDREARRLAASELEAVEAIAFDAAGSALVEACADACERAIYADASARGLFAGQRVSPGYGDIPLALSDGIVRVLEAGKRLGLSVAESGLLVPVKSVTALVGLFGREEDARRARRSCADCVARADCAYLKVGHPCYEARER